MKQNSKKQVLVDEFDEEDWQALFMADLEELYEYDKDLLRVF